MAAYAAITLLKPGTNLDREWDLNSLAYRQLVKFGRIAGLPFLVLAGTLFIAGIGWFKRRYWGWVLGVSIISVNLLGDIINVIRGEWQKGMIGVAVAGLLSIYTTRFGVRNYVGSQRRPS